jgi:glycosyltransferase involved in cell wall biosynthesis
LNIAIIADPFIPVPPQFYGGIERVIDLLITQLLKKGHQVTLFAHKDSSVNCKLVPLKEGAGVLHILQNIYIINNRLRKQKFDVVHSFGRLANLLLVMPSAIPKLMTYQREPTISQIKKAMTLSRRGTMTFTGCSNYISNQIATFAPVHTVYNGVDVDRYSPIKILDTDSPLIFLGRIEFIKGAHTAIEIAKRTGKKLIIAGNIDDNQRDYFDQQVKPFLDDQISYIGPVNDAQKNALLQKAMALLMPIHWNEPFGIVMIEAMACGTPVIGFRRGAVQEVVEHGKTGFVGDTIDELEEFISQIERIDRSRVRQTVEERFSSKVIGNQYLSIYEDMHRAPKPVK